MVCAGPVDQLVQRWTPWDGSTRLAITKVQGSRRDRRSVLMSLLTGVIAVSGRSWPGEIREVTGRTRLCVYVKYWTLNPAMA